MSAQRLAMQARARKLAKPATTIGNIRTDIPAKPGSMSAEDWRAIALAGAALVAVGAVLISAFNL